MASWLRLPFATADSGRRSPLEKDETKCITDSLMTELDSQMRDAEDMKREQEKESSKRRGSIVDYSWLVTSKPVKYYEMPPAERYEIEELCTKIKPEECTPIITRFREILDRMPPMEEMPQLLRAVILSVIQNRPKEETMMDWVRRRRSSIASLSGSFRQNSSKVCPTAQDSFSSSQDTEAPATPPTGGHLHSPTFTFCTNEEMV